VFLFDEPLSNLDAKLRIAMRVEIRKLQRRLATTSIYVTHDQLEAMTLADQLVVMNGGVVEQIGSPLDVYRRPATTFVASFIGAPPMNLIKLDGDSLRSQFPGGTEAGILGIRPEDLTLATEGGIPDGGVALELRVEAVERVGPESFIYGSRSHGGAAVSAHPGERPPGEIIVRVPGEVAPELGASIRAVAPRERLHLFGASGRRRVD
jgi:sn-glycerol 3-phosphate transport system ATP-binding protein